MATLVPIKAGELVPSRTRLYFRLVQTDGQTPATGENGGQPEISVDGGGYTASGIGPLVAIGSGDYYAEPVASLLLPGTRLRTRYKSASTLECPGDTGVVVAYDPYDAAGLAGLHAAGGYYEAFGVFPGDVKLWRGAEPGVLAAGRVPADVDAQAIADDVVAGLGAIGDPLLNPVPGTYPSGSAGARIGLLGSGRVTVVSPVLVNGDVELMRGDAYVSGRNRALLWEDTDDTWPNLTGAAITMEIDDGRVVVSGDVIQATGAGKAVRAQPLGADTEAIGEAGDYPFAVVATYAGTGTFAGRDDRVTLLRGTVTLLDREDA
jgi:hypothetical protein